MSTATRVPETWELTGDDARETLLATDGSGSSPTRSSACVTRTASAMRAPWRS